MMTRKTFPGTPAAVTASRRFAIETIGNLPRNIVDSVALAVSELATNCVRYARTDFTIEIEQTADQLRVEVTDLGGGTPTLRSPDPSEPSGRGLLLVRELTDEWGVDTIVDRPGKTVWFTVQLSTRPGALQDVTPT